MGRNRRDWVSLLVFACFWLVAAGGVWLGLTIVRATGLSGNTSQAAPTATKVPQRPQVLIPPPLTLASVFAPRPPSLARYGRKNLRTLIATGDVIPARSVNYKMVTYGDFLYPFRRTARYLRRADMTLVNLESPLISVGCPVVYEGMRFCGDPRFVQGLQYAGIDTACTANNHIVTMGRRASRKRGTTWARHTLDTADTER